MFLGHGLDEADQVLLLWVLQLGHQGGEAVEAAVDGLRLSGVDRRQHSQQHVVTCRTTQAETRCCFYDSSRKQLLPAPARVQKQTSAEASEQERGPRSSA